MATIVELKQALIKADAAGDTQSARVLANAINQMTATQPQPQQPVPVAPGQQPLPIESPVKPKFREEFPFQRAALGTLPGQQPDIVDAITGESKMTEEIEGLPTIGGLPELNKITVPGLKSAFVSVTSGPEETVQALQANFPGVQARQDEKGNYIVTSAEDGKDYIVEPPGLDPRQAVNTGLQVAFFTPTKAVTSLGLKVLQALPKAGKFLKAGKITKLGRLTLEAMGKQFGLETGQEAAGGERDLGEVALAGATELIPGAVGAVRGVGRAIAGRLPASAAEQAVESATKVGITPLTSDIIPPSTFAGRTAQAITERIPLVGTGTLRVTQKKQREAAVSNLLREFGADEVVPAADDVMEELLKKRGQRLTKLSNLKNDVIEKLSDRGVVDVSKTIGVLDDEIAKLEALNTTSVKPVINMFDDFKTAVQEQKLGNIELLRRQLGEQLKDPSLASVRSTGEKSLSKIYQSVRSDMGDFIKQTGDKKDFTKWKVGNAQLSKMVKELEIPIFKSVLKKGKSTPEEVRKILFSKKPSDIKLLYKNLTPEGKDRAKVAIFQEIVEKSGGIENITPEKFIRQVKKFEKSSEIFLKKEDKQFVSNLINALKLTERAPIAGAKPATGAELTAFALPTGLSWLLSGGPVTGLVGAGGIGTLAKAYESKPIRNLLLRLAKAPKGQEDKLLRQLMPLIQAIRQQKSEDQ